MKTYPEMNEKIAGILRLGAEPEQYAAQYIEELRAENAALQRQLNESWKSRIELAQILNTAFDNYCKKILCRDCPYRSDGEMCRDLMCADALIASGFMPVPVEKPAPPFKPGERVYTFTYDYEDLEYIDSRPHPTDYASYIFLGGNDRYAVLSPVVNDEQDYLKLSEYYYADYIRNENSCDCIMVPYSKCFRSKQEVKAALIKQEKRNERQK